MKLLPTLAWVLGSGAPIDARLLPLLQAILARGSLAAAVRDAGVSYRAAWGLLRDYERKLGVPLVDLAQGRAASLTAAGTHVLMAEQSALERLAPLFSELSVQIGPSKVPARTHAPPVLRVAASHDLALARMRDDLDATGALALELSFMGSLHALHALHEQSADVAGFHVRRAEHPGARRDAEPFVRLLHARRHRLVSFAERDQGLMVARRRSRQVKRLVDVATYDLRFVNRQRGSGTRLTIDALLQEEGVATDAIRGYGTEEFTHAAVAATIASGGADAGFGLRAAAHEYDLAFVPLIREKYYLAIAVGALRKAGGLALLHYLRSPAFAGIVRALPGYRAADPGAILEVNVLHGVGG
ncbi:MAG: LysR family transcriptional regulator [Pseudomonadota bacterium]|nr:LysR family transcriptional regulator [Pseudomonadota bacterium]